MNLVSPPGDDWLVALVSRLALVAALLVGLSLPLGYAGLSYRSHSKLVETVAYVKAGTITKLASSNPDLWMYEIPRLEELLAMPVTGWADEMASLRDAKGHLLISAGELPQSPALSRTFPVFESGRLVAQVEILHSAREDLYGTLIAALLGILLGGLTYTTLRVLPLRMLRRVTAELSEQHARYALAVESAMEGYLQVDTDGRVHQVNAALCVLTGYTREELLKLAITDLEVTDNDGHILLHDTDGSHERFERRWKRRDGAIIDVEVSAANLAQDKSRQFCFVRDITDKKRSDEQIWIQANFDSLTGLPNRRMFHDRLEQEIKKAHRAKHQAALLFIDLDDFKKINDTLGHDKGDILLTEAAHRINQCVRVTDTVARLGGDEFAVVLAELDDSNSVERIVQDIQLKLAEPYRLGDQVGNVSASIGIAIYPDDDIGATGLIKKADQAMYTAKKRGRNNYCYFVLAHQGS